MPLATGRLPVAALVVQLAACAKAEPPAAGAAAAPSAPATVVLTEPVLRLVLDVERAVRARAEAEAAARRARAEALASRAPLADLPRPAAADPLAVAREIGADPKAYERARRRIHELVLAERVRAAREAALRFRRVHLATIERSCAGRGDGERASCEAAAAEVRSGIEREQAVLDGEAVALGPELRLLHAHGAALGLDLPSPAVQDAEEPDTRPPEEGAAAPVETSAAPPAPGPAADAAPLPDLHP